MRRKKYDEQEFRKENTGYWRFWERFGDATILVLCNSFFLELWNVCTLFCNNDQSPLSHFSPDLVSVSSLLDKNSGIQLPDGGNSP